MLRKYLLVPLQCLILLSVASSFRDHKPSRLVDFCSSDRNNFESLLQIRGGKKTYKKQASVPQSKRESVFTSIVRSFFKIFEMIIPWKTSKRSGISNSTKKKTNVRHNSEPDMSTMDCSSGRIQKELKSFLSDPPENCELTVGKNIRSWVITLMGVNGTVFGGEKYKLQVKFPKEYPIKPPSVYFLKPCPKHVHVYSNGDICLNLLGKDWRPTMTVQGIAVSILSMLSSAKEKSMPQDNAMHSDSTPGQQQDNWMYHDDRC